MYTFENFKYSFEHSFTINQNSYFFEAIKNTDDNQDLFTSLLEEGACNIDINFYSLRYNHTPLSYAIAQGKHDIAIKLIKAGANPNLTVTGIYNKEYDDEEFIYPKIQKITKNIPKMLEKFEQFKKNIIFQGKTSLDLAFAQTFNNIAEEIIKADFELGSFDGHNRVNINTNIILLKILNSYQNLHLLKEPIPEESSSFICLMDEKIRKVEEKIQYYKQIVNDSFFTHAEISKDFYKQHNETVLNVLPSELIVKITGYIDFPEIKHEENNISTTEVLGEFNY